MPHWPTIDANLQCIPPVPKHISMPWDAADELLATQSRHLNNCGRSPDLIIGDRYGALACAYPSALVYTDSLSAKLAIQTNLLKNKLPQACISFDLTEACLNAASQANHQPIIAAKFPKQFDLLQLYVHEVSKINGRLMLAGMQKHIPVKWLNWLEDHSDGYQQSRIIKKARLVSMEPRNTLETSIGRPDKHYQLDDLTLSATAGVYGREALDPGAAAIMAFLPSNHSGRIADLGCGNGVLSLKLKQTNPAAEIVGIDDSYRAIVAAEHNSQQANLAIQWQHSDVLQQVEGQFDFIVCNPPFHDGHKILSNIAERMFQQSHQSLIKGGVLLVVANRHLPYFKLLKNNFSVSTEKCSDTRFSIYRCQKI